MSVCETSKRERRTNKKPLNNENQVQPKWTTTKITFFEENELDVVALALEDGLCH